MAPQTTTIWLWPTGLFTRRIIYYFRAKQITLSALAAHNIHLLPVILSAEGKLVTKEGYEQRPEGTSVPCMRIAHSDGKTTRIHESVAIVAYLEEIFGAKEGYEDIMGSTTEQRARTGDVVSVLADAIVWGSVVGIHSDPSTLAWSGLTACDMSPSAAADAKKRFHYYLSKLEGWVEKDVVERGTKSISGEGAHVTLADLVLMASVSYAQDYYQRDWIEEHGVLRVWCHKAKNDGWCVGWEGLKGAEETGWQAVLGE